MFYWFNLLAMALCHNLTLLTRILFFNNRFNGKEHIVFMSFSGETGPCKAHTLAYEDRDDSVSQMRSNLLNPLKSGRIRCRLKSL